MFIAQAYGLTLDKERTIRGEPSDRTHVDHRDVGRLFRLVGRIDDVSGGLRLEDKHALAGQDHGAAAALTVDQHRVVRRHPPNDLAPGDPTGRGHRQTSP